MIVGHIGGSSAAYNIANSLRFRASASASLNRTPSAASNRRTWTWSGWVKRGLLGASPFGLFSAKQTKDDTTYFAISSDKLVFLDSPAAVTNAYLVTTPVFRDPSAHYHVVMQVDTTNVTASDRLKVYVNGQRITGFDSATYPAQNYEVNYINNTVDHRIGTFQDNSSLYFDGYLSEVNFIDGQALTPSSFGEADALTGSWVPKKYTGTYGTNGFYLPFNDGSNTTNLCLDRSGNGNNWTPNNISLTAGSTYDWMVDTPTNNYAVLNPLGIVAGDFSLANGNLRVTSSNAPTSESAFSTVAAASGKWYCEVLASTVTDAGVVGVCPVTIRPNQGFYTQTGGVAYYLTNGTKFVSGANTAYGAAATAGDVIGIALDMDAQQVTFYKNNVSQGAISATLSGDYVFAAGDGSGTTAIDYSFNFGQRPFTYTPPTGFKALCTANLPAVSVPNPKSHFDALTWTGSGAARSFTGYKFQPDLVWAKSRSNAYNHHLADAVRGATKYLIANDTAAEATNVQSLTSFNADGFSVGTLPEWNDNLATFVGWMWKAGGAAVTNNSGSISSQVSTNVQAGFSIAAYTGTGVAGTIGHGLGIAPKLIILRDRDNLRNSFVLHNDGNTLRQLEGLNTQAGSSTPPAAFNNANPTSTTFPVAGVTGVNANTAKHIAYCFAEVPGFSKFGSYVGNGSADGPFVYCGFRPRWVLIKCSSNAGTNWQIIDTARNTGNVSGARLRPNEYAAEFSPDTSRQIDILANGFKVRHYDAGTGDGNISGYTYIYAAFAESPFGGAGIAPANAR